MRHEAVLRMMGERIAEANCRMGVPERFCATWYAGWGEIVDKAGRGEVSILEACEALSAHARQMTLAAVAWTEV